MPANQLATWLATLQGCAHALPHHGCQACSMLAACLAVLQLAGLHAGWCLTGVAQHTCLTCAEGTCVACGLTSSHIGSHPQGMHPGACKLCLPYFVRATAMLTRLQLALAAACRLPGAPWRTVSTHTACLGPACNPCVPLWVACKPARALDALALDLCALPSAPAPWRALPSACSWGMQRVGVLARAVQAR